MKAVLFFSLLIVSRLLNASSPDVILGVIEEAERMQHPIVAKILFAKTKGKWTVLNTIGKHEILEREMTWVVAFDGRNIGTLKTVDDYNLSSSDCEWCFSRDKMIRIENQEDIPKLGNKEKRFWNWSFLPKNRPLVINTREYFKDGESWSRFKPDRKVLERIYPHLESLLGNTYHCNGEPNWDATKVEVSISDIDFHRSYINKSGKMIISAGLSKEHTQSCDGPLDETQQPIWFYVSNDVRLIGYEIDLLDAGDYDNDGDIEFIFSHNGYNKDGYSLYDSEFQERYDYFWSYH